MEFVFLCLGLGFLLYVTNGIRKDENNAYNRELNEKREFGYDRVMTNKKDLKTKKK